MNIFYAYIGTKILEASLTLKIFSHGLYLLNYRVKIYLFLVYNSIQLFIQHSFHINM